MISGVSSDWRPIRWALCGFIFAYARSLRGRVFVLEGNAEMLSYFHECIRCIATKVDLLNDVLFLVHILSLPDVHLHLAGPSIWNFLRPHV